jgi:hypothetical protein
MKRLHKYVLCQGSDNSLINFPCMLQQLAREYIVYAIPFDFFFHFCNKKYLIEQALLLFAFT